MKWIAWTMLCASAALISGCATGGNCAGWAPVNPSVRDVLTAGTEQQILKHNEFGAKQCGWRPAR